MKKRILFVNEFSQLPTGYGTYGKDLISRLYATGKYEIAEFATYVQYSDKRIDSVPWKVYANMPENNDPNAQDYSNPINQFGAWRFEEVCLDWKADTCASLRDNWMDSFIESSPLRKYFNQIWLAPVDSSPQEEQWIDTCIQCDAVLTFTDWGKQVLEREGNGKINLIGAAPGCPDFNAFFIIPNKLEHRKKHLFINPEANIIGTVMRNQPRKLFPDLFASFRKFLDETRSDSYLYCHTGHPDSGWDIPRLLRDYGLGNRVLFTYICEQCHNFLPSLFSDAFITCHKCRGRMTLSNSRASATPQQLGEIYNLFDVYVQYAIAEGQGFGQTEAAACGIPIMSVDGTAMSDIVRKLDGWPIKIQKEFLESGTHAYRYYPDNEHLTELLKNFFSLPKQARLQKGFQTRKLCEKYYNWEDSAKVWEKAIDSLPSKDWNLPPSLHQWNGQVPNIASNEDFVNWAIVNVLGSPELLNSYFSNRLCKELNHGMRIPGFGGSYINEMSIPGSRIQYHPFNREIAINTLLDLRNKINYWEQRRCGMIQEPVPNYIRYAR